MATKTRSAKNPIATTSAKVGSKVRRNAATLSVLGSIPAELDGNLLRAVRHPACPAETDSAAMLLDGGIQLRDGHARWYRQPARQHVLDPAWRTARMRPGGLDPDEVGPASVASPVTDPATGLAHTVATYPGLDHAEHICLRQDGTIQYTAPFALEGAPLMHTVAKTGRFLVVFDLPVTHRRAAALLGEALPYTWQDERPARVGLLEPGTDRPRWFAVAPCYVFDAVNAYDSVDDDGDRVVVDVVRHERAFDRTAERPAPPALWRWTLDLRTGTVEERPLAPAEVARPEVDPRLRGRRHRFVFGAGDTALYRHDVRTGTTQVRELGQACRAERPVFVPRSASAAEGDGWLITVVHDYARGHSELLILDAADLCGQPVAIVHVPFRLPASVHTRWQPGN